MRWTGPNLRSRTQSDGSLVGRHHFAQKVAQPGPRQQRGVLRTACRRRGAQPADDLRPLGVRSDALSQTFLNLLSPSLLRPAPRESHLFTAGAYRPYSCLATQERASEASPSTGRLRPPCVRDPCTLAGGWRAASVSMGAERTSCIMISDKSCHAISVVAIPCLRKWSQLSSRASRCSQRRFSPRPPRTRRVRTDVVQRRAARWPSKMGRAPPFVRHASAEAASPPMRAR